MSNRLEMISASRAKKLFNSLGFASELAFWSSISDLPTGTCTDHMINFLSNAGFVGTPDDMLNAWLSRLSGVSSSRYDMLEKVSSITSLTQIGVMSYPGLTFYKNYATSQATANADYSGGSGTVTVTAARSASAPATYFDASGVIQTTTTANVPRWTQGFYDATGFRSRPGLLVENSVTNRALQSSVFENASWTKTNMTAADGVVLAGSPMATVSTIIATDADATLTQAYTDAVAGIYTASIHVRRKTGTGTISLRANTADSYTDLTASVSASYWTRIQVQSSSATNPTFDLKITTIGDELYVVAADLVKLAYATSHIPITTTARTRAAETVSYPILNNRTAPAESIFIKYTALGRNWVNDSIQRTLTSTDTKNRDMRKSNTGTTLRTSPNVTDNSGVVATAATTAPVAGTSYVFAGTMQHNPPTPYVASSMDGEREGTYTAGDFTDPAWGTNFYVGCASTGTLQANGIMEAIAIYGNFKDVPDVNHISNLLSSAVTYKNYEFIPQDSASSNLVSGSAGTGNVVTNPVNAFLWMDTYACSDVGYVGDSNRTGETWRCFFKDGSDAETTAGDPAPNGDIVMRTYTKSTNSMSTPPTTIYTDATYSAIEIFAYRNPSESFIRVYFSRAVKATFTYVDLCCIKSTDLTCSSWGTPQVVINEVIRQPWNFVDLPNGLKGLVCGSCTDRGGKVCIFSTSDFDNFTFYSSVSSTTASNPEGGCVNDPTGTGRMLLVCRVNSGDYLQQATSSDYGLTWSSLSSTGLGDPTLAKVKPDVIRAAGSSDRIIPYFYDRGDDRVKIGTPTKFSNAFVGTWGPTYLIGTSAQGNGGLMVIDETLRRYIVSTQSTTSPTNDYRWWIFQDIYSWVAL